MFKLYKEILDFFALNIKEISLIIIITELPLILLNNLAPNQVLAKAGFLILVLGILSMAISNSAMTILFSMFLNKEKPDIGKALIKSFSYLPKMIIAIMIYGAFVMLGVLLLIIPGIIIGARLSLYNYYIIYENKEPFEAIKESAIKTNGFTLQITALFMVMFAIVTTPYFITIKYFSISKITSPFILIGSDLFFSILGTLVLVLTFRIYCLIKEKGGIYF